VCPHIIARFLAAGEEDFGDARILPEELWWGLLKLGLSFYINVQSEVRHKTSNEIA
jgi:hypothetical protein